MSESYEKILKRMCNKYTEITGSPISRESDIYIRLSVLAGEIFNHQVNMDWIKRQMFCDSAEGEWLDYHAESRGLSRHGDSYSEGVCVFSSSFALLEDVLIPKGTLVAAKDDESLCFETTEDGIILTDTTSVHIPVRALSKGRRFNVAAESITRFITPVAQVVRVTNPDRTEGGADKESDESLRKRVRESFFAPSNGTNRAYYTALATGVEGVASASAVPRVRGAGTVDVYIAAEGAEVTDETLYKVQALLSQKREINVDVLVRKASAAMINFNLIMSVEDGYDFDEVSRRCESAVRDYINSRPIGAKIMRTAVGEVIYHTEGVKEYNFDGIYNIDVKCGESEFPLAGGIVFKESESV